MRISGRSSGAPITELAGSCGYSVCHVGEIHDLVFTPPCEESLAIAQGETGQAGGYQITNLQSFVGPYCEGPPTVRHHWVMQRL